ncbi:P-loop containing nucleoside triphosphate hydrolase protein [Mucor mucedo]|uniref:P-loop containing nucleoside triphosphate hydrolase protein n=1 Tax=Mucor mucedo TaxID=29922 RepID=UPI00221F4987|nr:P-loop containing nucleoside triphosphate hydrolase protein [Mucor mucedo]KAI7887830.1 P-loop containing nucleoside triphosphate hydrolase protein [Mucor mucedo]
MAPKASNIGKVAPRTKSSSQQPKIKVCVRKRPLNREELARQEQDVAHLSDSRTIQIHASRKKVDLTSYVDQHSFTFDEVFDVNTCNRTIYQKTAKPLVDYMFQGGKSTCFAYGQTGSGKTYTMLDAKHGLYVQATADIFRLLETSDYGHLQAWVGYYEIYQGQLYDLLNGRRLIKPLEDGRGHVKIAGLKEYRIQSSETMLQVFQYGNQSRTTSKTQSNETSSRSHAVLQVLLKARSEIHGKLSFIDLAGSERGTDRGTDMKLRMEGAEINKSLLALKECIRALDRDKSYAPFRGSKLTMVLKDSFVGNSRTCMIATVSPNGSNSDHTLNTLRYADRVKELRGESDPRLSNNHDISDNNNDAAASGASGTDDADVNASNTTNKEEEKTGLTKAHVTDFIHWHQVQLGGNEIQLREDNEMIAELENLLDTEISSEEIQKRFVEYKRNVQHLLDRKSCLVENLKNRIAKELVDEHEI